MTFMNENLVRNDGLKLAISVSLYNTMQRFEDYRNYRKTLAGLRGLDNAQLADLGLRRSELTRVAQYAVYGKGA